MKSEDLELAFNPETGLVEVLLFGAFSVNTPLEDLIKAVQVMEEKAHHHRVVKRALTNLPSKFEDLQDLKALENALIELQYGLSEDEPLEAALSRLPGFEPYINTVMGLDEICAVGELTEEGFEKLQIFKQGLKQALKETAWSYMASHAT